MAFDLWKIHETEKKSANFFKTRLKKFEKSNEWK